MGMRYVTSEDIRRNLVNLTQLVFEVTDDCNLSCVYCAYGNLYCDYDKREKKYMQLRDVRLLIDHLAEVWQSSMSEAAVPETFIGFYGGEPLLNMVFIKEVINYIESLGLNRKFRYSLTTNAVLLDKHMHYLVEKDFSLLISLDGDEYANGYRVNLCGLNPHKGVLQNIKILRDEYPDYYKRQVNFNSVLHNRNDVETVIDFFKKEFSKTPELSELSTTGINPANRSLFEKMYNNMSDSFRQSDKYDKLVDDAFIQCPEVYSVLRFVEVESKNVYDSYEQLLPKSNNDFVPTGTCIPFSRKMFVTVNGKILPCERVSHAYYLGKVSRDEICLDFQKIAEKHNEYLNKILRCCETCACVSCCLKCVYQIDRLETDNIACEKHMTRIESETYNNNCYRYLRSKSGLYSKLLDVIK